MAPDPFDAGTERTVVALLRHLQWQADRFSIAFVFADVGPAATLRRWLDERLQLDRRELRIERTDRAFYAAPAEAVERVVDAALSAEPDRGAVWFELHPFPGDALVDDTRRRLLARLNERRFVLESGVRVPRVMALPPSFRTEKARLAPDLWHVRAVSVTLTTADHAATAPVFDEIPFDRADRATEPTGRVGTNAALADWRRSVGRHTDSGPYLPTAFGVVSRLIAAGRLEEAAEVAEEAVATARRRLDRGEPGRTNPVRDLSSSLNSVGDVARARGDLDTAESAFAESLELARRLVERTGETSKALRDLSVSLDRVGDVARARGDLDAAESAFAESLELDRRLVERTGETSKALRDLSVSLDRVGDVARARGDLDAAESAFAESLELDRRLVERTGETPGALRDLSVSLLQLGRLREDTALLDEALAIA